MTSEKTIANTDRDVSCKALDADADDDAAVEREQSASIPTREERSASPDVPEADAPEGAAGFVFGAAKSDGEASCTGAGHEWSKIASGHYRCSGAATEVGFEVSVGLRYCEGELCSITLVHRPERQWYESLGELRSALEGKYGEPSQDQTTLEYTCQRDGRFEQCLLHGAGSSRVTWAWSKDQKIELVAGKPTPDLDGETKPSLRILYTKPVTPLRAKPAAL
jgi:hypothetical protein